MEQGIEAETLSCPSVLLREVYTNYCMPERAGLCHSVGSFVLEDHFRMILLFCLNVV